MKPRRSFTVYSAELYDKTGRGTLSVTAPRGLPPEEFAKWKEEKKAEQDAANQKYRELLPRPRKGARKNMVPPLQREPVLVARDTTQSVHTSATHEGAPGSLPVGVTLGEPEVTASMHDVKLADKMRPSLPAIEVSQEVALRLDGGTGNSTVLLGSSKAGKTTVMMHLFAKYYGGKDYISILFAANPQIEHYKDKKHLIVASQYEPKLVRMAQKVQKGTGNHYRFCFLLDDMLDQRDDRALKSLVLSYRNSDLSSLVCLQYSNLLAKNSRANVNNILLFRFNSQEAIEIVVNQFLRSFFRRLGVAPEDMVDFYKKATEDHGFIYIHPASDTISFHRLKI